MPCILSENPYANPGYAVRPPPVPAAPGNPWTPAPPQQDVQEPGPDPQAIELPDGGRAGVITKYTSYGGMDIRHVVEVRSLVCANCQSRYNESHLEDQVDLTGEIQDPEGTMAAHPSQDLAG